MTSVDSTDGVKESHQSPQKDEYCGAGNTLLVTKGISPSERLLTTDFSCVRQMKRYGKLVFIGSLCCIVRAHTVILDIDDTIDATHLFGSVWLQTKYGNGQPNVVTTVVDSVVNSFQQS